MYGVSAPHRVTANTADSNAADGNAADGDTAEATSASSMSSARQATLTELCARDKEKVANLIRELAKLGRPNQACVLVNINVHSLVQL